MLQARAKNTILYDGILVILYLYCERIELGLPTFCFAIPVHFNTKNSKIDAAEAYETRIDIKSNSACCAS